ncbi:MAG: WD40 repeat domain-containing protein, partial [Rhodospirillales bacterium]|nr:WD40 repeat domain-containing protein [Rhodospirillales bacterium]
CCDEEVRVFDPVADGEALLVLDVGSEVKALVAFADPATGAPRLVCGTSMDYGKSGDVRIFDPVAGGEALVVINVGSEVLALAVFADPATGAPRLASGSNDKKVRVFDPLAGGEAFLVIDVGERVNALAVFTDPATGAPRLACGCQDGKVRIFDPIAGGEALLVIDVGSRVLALAVFADPA